VSHQHPSHSYVRGIGGDPREVIRPGEYEISGVLIIGVATFHDAVGGKTRGKNTVYLMEVDGVSICHLGDLGHVLTAEQVEEMPKAVVPMHYKTPALSRKLEPVSEFLKEMGVEQIKSQPKLSLTKSSLPVSTQVFLLDYQ